MLAGMLPSPMAVRRRRSQLEATIPIGARALRLARTLVSRLGARSRCLERARSLSSARRHRRSLLAPCSISMSSPVARCRSLPRPVLRSRLRETLFGALVSSIATPTPLPASPFNRLARFNFETRATPSVPRPSYSPLPCLSHRVLCKTPFKL